MSHLRVDRTLILSTCLAIVACSQPATAPVEPEGPIEPGTTPAVTLTLGFGFAPVVGEVVLTPIDETPWMYSVDLEADGTPEHVGQLSDEVGFRYRFETPGVHTIVVTFEVPGAVRSVSKAVAVNDPGRARILAQRDISDEAGTFEGITMDHQAESVYVANYSGGSLFRLDPSDLTVLGGVPLNYSAEGLSVSPSDSLLVVTHKYHDLTVVAIPSLQVRQFLDRSETGSYFIHALDDSRALASGVTPFVLVDTQTGNALAQVDFSTESFPNGHFSLSPDKTSVAVLGQVPPSVYLLTIPDLATQRVISLPNVEYVTHVAFHPAGDRVYVLGSDAQDNRHFLAIDVGSGAVLEDMSLGVVLCWLCVANPVAVQSDGRYVVFALTDAAFFIDTELDVPVFRLDATGSGVTASPAEPAFYFLRSDGIVTKVAVD